MKVFNATSDIKSIPQFSQTQKELSAQLADLYHVANRLGLYDAADHLRRYVGQ